MNRGIEVSTTLRADVARAGAVLTSDPAAAFCDTCSAEARRDRVIRAQLAVDLHGGGRVGHEVELRFGLVQAIGAETVLPLSWHATGREHLYPTFEGTLHVTAAEHGACLRLVGTYGIPLGIAGGFGNGIAGRRVARRALTTFLGEIARRVEGCVDDQRAWIPETGRFVAFHEQVGPENFVG